MDSSQLSVEAQLAVLNTKLDTLIGYSRELSQDHESRLRAIESTYVTEVAVEARNKRHLAVITTVCVILTAVINTVSYLVR